jgi:MerR family copper efflux transcriptional regulator
MNPQTEREGGVAPDKESLRGISALARSCGVSAKALRLYEARGLLGTVQRRGSYRLYSEAQLARVRMIRLAQSLGFRLAELQWIADGDWLAAERQLRQREFEVQSEIQRLHGQLEAIRQARADIATCPQLAAAGHWPDCQPTRSDPRA